MNRAQQGLFMQACFLLLCWSHHQTLFSLLYPCILLLSLSFPVVTLSQVKLTFPVLHTPSIEHSPFFLKYID